MSYKNKIKLTPNEKAIHDRNVVIALQEASEAGQVGIDELVSRLPEMTRKQIAESLVRCQKAGLIIDGRELTEEQRFTNSILKNAIVTVGVKAQVAQANNMSIGNPAHNVMIEAAYMWFMGNHAAQKAIEEAQKENDSQ